MGCQKGENAHGEPGAKRYGNGKGSLAKRFGVHPDDLLELLPNGRSKTMEPGKAR